MNNLFATSPRPALLHESYALQLRAALQIAQAPKANGMAMLGDLQGAKKPFGYAAGIAVIGVQGCLIDKLGWWGSSCVTGYDTLRWQAEAAHSDPDVAAIVLDVDSYGGMVPGCFDLCDHMVELKQASGKPVAAILSEFAYSAGYALASTADTIAVPRTGGLGSIGVIQLHWNIAKALEKWGEEVTIIAAGQHKPDGNPYEALPDDVKARLLVEVEDVRQLFAATVARNRAGAPAAPSLEAILGTEARRYDGPAQLAEAVALGLADAVMSPSAAFAAFAAHVNAA
jgi:ClpP class serine protease